jgi:hypothetical protein
MKHKLNTPKHTMDPKPFSYPFFELNMMKYAMDPEPFPQLFFESNMLKYAIDSEPFSYPSKKQSLSNETLALKES